MRNDWRRLIGLMIGGVMIGAGSVWAQAVPTPEAVVGWKVQVYAAGVDPASGQPITTIPATRAGTVCGQVMMQQPATAINPKQIRVSDPDDSTKDCILGPSPTTLLMALPLGQFFAVASTVSANFTSVISPPSNAITRAATTGPPPTPVRITIW